MKKELAELRAYKEAVENHEPAPADKPARITEQDAREIAISVMRYCHENSNWYPDAWREDRGRELLNKLNADREQVPAAAVPDGFREIVEAVAHIGVDFGYGNFSLSQEHIEKARELLAAAPSHSQQSANEDKPDAN